MKSSIALIGFMGVGKSAAGRLLAEKIGKVFVEVDALIEEKAGKSIKRIFEEEG
jgi:shikimate kinase